MRGLLLTMWMRGLLVAMWMMAALRAAPAVDKDLGKGRLCQYQVDKEGVYLEINCVEADMCRSMALVPPSLGSISLEVWITGVAGSQEGGRSRLRLCSRLQYAPAQSHVLFPDFLQQSNLPIFPQIHEQAGQDNDEEGKIDFPDLPIPQLDYPEDSGDTFDDVTDDISNENQETFEEGVEGLEEAFDFGKIFEKTFGFGEQFDESFTVSEETSMESESVLELEEEFSVSEEAMEDVKEAMIDTKEANVEEAMVDTEEANVEEAMVDTEETNVEGAMVDTEKPFENDKESMETVDEVEVSEDITGMVDSKTAVGADGLFDSLDLLSQAVAFITE